MKTVIICISDIYLERGRQLMRYYRSLGDEVEILTPDFSHRKKQAISWQEEGIRLLAHRPYLRNLSAARLRGHYEFAKTCRSWLEKHPPQRIHCLIPANSLAMQMDGYHQEHPEVQLIFDVNDLWPESLPMKGLQNLPVFAPWKNLRDHHLAGAELVISECRLFSRHLEKLNLHSPVVYWTGDRNLPDVPDRWNDDEFTLAYLGSMNNIIDIDLIGQILKKIAEHIPPVIHLIGAGENHDALVRVCQKYAKVIDHGQLYDPREKQKIFASCRFGLNVMKPEVSVGLSLKSLDYLAAGLPVLNSLQGDTKELVESEKIGLNIDRSRLDSLVETMVSLDRKQIEQMKRQAKAVYSRYFTPEAFDASLSEALEKVGLLDEKERSSLKKRRNR